MALSHETRRALVERVRRRVEGRGIPRRVIEDAVSRVADALDVRASAPAPASAITGSIVAVFSAPAMPDLGSRVRAGLSAEAVTPLGIGTASAGRHTVATVRLPADARPVAERVAAALPVSVSFVSDSSPSSASTS